MKKQLGLLAIVVIAVVVAIAAVSLQENPDALSQLPEPGETSQLSEDQVQSVIERVNRLILLPQDDQPLVAQIVDVSDLLQQQAFYQGAENGDYLVIYPSIQKALVYSPTRDILVNAGPIQVQADALQQQAAQQQQLQQQSVPQTVPTQELPPTGAVDVTEVPVDESSEETPQEELSGEPLG